jgi:hypothetical protein
LLTLVMPKPQKQLKCLKLVLEASGVVAADTNIRQEC